MRKMKSLNFSQLDLLLFLLLF